MMSQTMYCVKELREQDNTYYYQHIYPTKGQVSMCSSQTPVKIQVSETDCNNKDTPYYGWKYSHGHISMIYPHLTLLKICFPYGLKTAEENKEGKAIKVIIKEIT